MKLFVCVLALTLIAASPATQPASSADGVQYGEPVGDLVPVKLTKGVTLGGSPSLLIGNRDTWSRDRSRDQANKILGVCGDVLLPSDGTACKFYAKGSTSDVVAFDVTNGRVNRVILYFFDSREHGVDKIQQDLQAAAGKSPIRIKIERLHFAAQNGVAVDGPAGICLTIHPVDFYLALHPSVAPDLAANMRSGKLVIGMDEEVANATMWPHHRIVRIERTDQKLVAWQHLVVHERNAFGVATSESNEDAITAWIADGKISEIVRLPQ